MHGANGSAHRRSHRRGPPYRDSAIAAPTHNYFSLNSQFTGASTPPGPYSSARRQYTSRVPPEYPAGAAHLKRLPRVAHLRAARPQARGDEEPTGKPRPAVRLPSTSVTQADCREAWEHRPSLPQEMDRYQRIDKIGEGLMTTFYPSQPSMSAHRYIWCCLQSNRQSSCQRHHSVSINFRFRQLVRL